MKRGMSVGDHVQNDTNWISASEAKAEKQEIQEKITQRTHEALTQDVDGITLTPPDGNIVVISHSSFFCLQSLYL